MELDKVTWFDAVQPPAPMVQIKPSGDRNIFVGHFGGEAHVGSRANLSGVKPEDARAMEAGDTSSLAEYLVEDPELPGTFYLHSCRAALKSGQYHSVGVSDDVLREYAPAQIGTESAPGVDETATA